MRAFTRIALAHLCPKFRILGARHGKLRLSGKHSPGQSAKRLAAGGRLKLDLCICVEPTVAKAACEENPEPMVHQRPRRVSASAKIGTRLSGKQ